MRLMIAGLEAVDLRRQRLRLQQAVDAVADAEAVLLRLDVDVAGPLVGRLDEDLVDQLDDRRFLGLLGQLAVVGLDVFEQLDLVLGRAPATSAVTVSPPTPKCVLDEPGDLARAGQHRLDVQAGERLQLVEGVDVERVAGGDDERAVVPGERHQVAAVDQLQRHAGERLRLDRRSW